MVGRSKVSLVLRGLSAVALKPGKLLVTLD